MYDGMRFTRSRKCVTLPGPRHAVLFGRVCKKDTPNAVRTNAKWRGGSPYRDEAENGEYPVYAIPVPEDGHSSTNVMYGKDGYIYLAYGGEVFVHKYTKAKSNV